MYTLESPAPPLLSVKYTPGASAITAVMSLEAVRSSISSEVRDECGNGVTRSFMIVPVTCSASISRAARLN